VDLTRAVGGTLQVFGTVDILEWTEPSFLTWYVEVREHMEKQAATPLLVIFRPDGGMMPGEVRLLPVVSRIF
jgi:hypothetical protein